MSFLLELLFDFLGFVFLESSWDNYEDLSRKSPTKHFWIKALFLVGSIIYFFTTFIILLVSVITIRNIKDDGWTVTTGLLLSLFLVLMIFLFSKLPKIFMNLKTIFLHSSRK
ncbi:hypothetical protein BN1356_01108 [Streptococcus varani]|uniref:Uncharacterized protein n=1 Tax=Streptococcus varani TaxID=1608583 RepID=A0A0E4H3V3_9STRE|nr:hypothetical protein BN1356_01108 [Streptococcus varani]